MEERRGSMRRSIRGAVFVIIVAMIIAAVVLVVCLIQNKNINQFRSEGASLYTWVGEERLGYQGSELIFDRSKSDQMTELKIDGEIKEVDSTPFFFMDERKVLFPQEMVIVQPRVDNGKQGRLPSLAIIDGTNVEPKMVFADIRETIGTAFVFDGRDLYFFVNPMKLEFNGESMELPAFSYVTYNFNHELYVYDYNKEEAQYFENVENVKALTDKYSIDLATDTFTVNDKSRLLVTNPGVLEVIR